MMRLNYPLFDGTRVIENASVEIENGIITAVTEAESESNNCLLMPGLIDAHVHLGNEAQVENMLKSGVVAACDVSASEELIKASQQLEIVSSAGMAMGMLLNTKGFVEKAAENGARYIKVLLFNSLSIGKPALCGIVRHAHEKGLKVAVHATEIATVQQAVDAGADILLHVPMKEEFPKELAMAIAEKGIVVVPTLVMMETFATSDRNGYLPEHYQNAEKAVRLLRQCGVTILVGTDANPGSFAPGVAFGTSMHRELALLAKAGLPPIEVLSGATSKNAEVFGIEGLGTVAEGKRANLLLIEGRPDREIKDTWNIRQMWMHGKPVLERGD